MVRLFRLYLPLAVAVTAITVLTLGARAGVDPGISLSPDATVYILAGEPVVGQHTPPPQAFVDGAPDLATISITYTGSWPLAAKTALQFAADIWETQVASGVTIQVTADWSDSLPPGALGGAGPAQYFANFSGAPVSNTWYPSALANKLAGADLDTGEPDIAASFSSEIPNWYYGTDGDPGPTQYDFVSVALHELGHGLGFGGSMRYGSACGSAGFGCWGWGTSYPAVYDRFTENSAGSLLITLPNYSVELGNALISGSVYFDGPNARGGNGGVRVPLYAPSPWLAGSSYNHLSEVYNGTVNALMTYSIGQGETQHNPGPVNIGMFLDMGWTLQQPSATPTRTPTKTPTRTPTKTPTATATPTATRTPTPSATPTLITMTPATPSYLPVIGRAYTPTPTKTPTPSPVWINLTLQTFEGAFPGAWTLADATGGSYTFGKRSCMPYGGVYSGWALGGGSDGGGLPCGANYPDAAESWMIYGPFSLEGATMAELTFKAWYNTESGADYVRWMASPDGGTYYGWQISGASGSWTDLTLDLDDVPGYGSFLGDEEVWVAVQFTSDADVNLPHGLHVDNLTVRKCTSFCTGLLDPRTGWEATRVERPD